MSKKTEDLISQLTDDMETPSRKAPNPLFTTLIVAVVSFIYVVFMFTAFYSFRHDMETLSHDPFFIAEIALASTLGLLGIMVAFFSAIPGRIKSMAPIHALFSVGVAGLIGLFMISSKTVDSYTVMNFLEDCDCIVHIGVFALPALVLTFLTLKKLAPTDLRTTSAYAAASSAFIGYAFLRLHCEDVASEHYIIVHMGAVALYGLVAYFLGRKILDW